MKSEPPCIPTVGSNSGVVKRILVSLAVAMSVKVESSLSGKRSGCRQLALERFVPVDNLPDEVTFLAVRAREETALESGNDNVAQFARGHFQFIHCDLQFFADGRIGDKPVVGTDGNRKFMVEHLPERMPGKVTHMRQRLGIAGQANFDRDAPVRDVFGETLRVRLGVWYARILNHVVREHPRAVADAVRVTLRDRLKD